MSRRFISLDQARYFTLGARMLGHGQNLLGIFTSISAAQQAAEEYFKANGISDEIIWEDNTIGNVFITGYQGNVPDDWDKIDVFRISGIALNDLNLDGWYW